MNKNYSAVTVISSLIIMHQSPEVVGVTTGYFTLVDHHHHIGFLGWLSKFSKQPMCRPI